MEKLKDIENGFVKDNAQVSRFMDDGNPNAQEVSADKKSAQVVKQVKQAIKDDQGLSEVARDIHVSVTNGTIILEGTVYTEQQMNLATNTATAVGDGEKVDTKIELACAHDAGKGH